MNEFNVINMY